VLSVFAINTAGATAEVVIPFVIDTVAPVIGIDGVNDGDIGNQDVTPLVSISEANPDSETVTLNDLPFTSGTSVVSQGAYVLSVSAVDRAGNTAAVSVAFDIDKIAPLIVVEGVEDGRVYDAAPAYLYDLEASDADGDTVGYRLVVAPGDMAIDAQTGVITWKPEQAGEFNVTVEAFDPNNGVDAQAFVLAVKEANASPEITSQPPTTATASTPYTYAVEAEDLDGDILTYSLSTAPAGMSIDAASGAITWMPAVAGPESVTVRVEDVHGNSATQSFTIEVAPGVLDGSAGSDGGASG
jgi:hypothetical protein